MEVFVQVFVFIEVWTVLACDFRDARHDDDVVLWSLDCMCNPMCYLLQCRLEVYVVVSYSFREGIIRSTYQADNMITCVHSPNGALRESNGDMHVEVGCRPMSSALPDVRSPL